MEENGETRVKQETQAINVCLDTPFISGGGVYEPFKVTSQVRFIATNRLLIKFQTGFETNDYWCVAKGSLNAIVRLGTHASIPFPILKDMFFVLLGPSIRQLLSVRRRGGPKEQKATAIIPTSLHQLIVGTMDIHIDTAEGCHDFLQQWHRYEHSSGGYAIVVPPLTIKTINYHSFFL